MNGSWNQWSSWQPCSVTCGAGHRIRARTCSNPAPKWNGKDCPGTNIYTESCNVYKCKGSLMSFYGSFLLKMTKWYHYFDALLCPLPFFRELSYFLICRMFYNCSYIISWAPLSFSHDGKIKHSREEVHEFNAARLTGSRRTSRGILTKTHQLFRLLIYRLTYLLN